MRTWKRLTPSRLPKVCERILAMNAEEKRLFCEAFDEFLDSLRDEDCFGTEGQCDPRGDPRT